LVEEVGRSGLYVQPWHVIRGTNAPLGADVWLVLQGAHLRGLNGHGVVVRGSHVQPEAGSRRGDCDTPPAQVLVAFDALLPLGDHIAPDVLRGSVPAIPWDSLQTACLAVDPAEEAGIRSVWTAFGPTAGPNPHHLVPGTYPEAAVTRVPVNRYERDPEARRACIAHRGSTCAACGFSFEVSYGEIGKDFIDFHHVVPAARLGDTYELDPLTDLIPLCANCHAIAHQGVSTPRSEAELRQAMAGAGFLPGAVVSPEQLEAERAAREILGP
jgi:5-methylcytosine-specific restriction protein A